MKRKHQAQVVVKVLDENGNMVALPPLWMNKDDNFILLNEKNQPIAEFIVTTIAQRKVEEAT
jgi:hypothetical protein